jgi:hypothetical protein
MSITWTYILFLIPHRVIYNLGQSCRLHNTTITCPDKWPDNPTFIWTTKSHVKPFILPIQITNSSKTLVLLYIQTSLYKLNEIRGRTFEMARNL